MADADTAIGALERIADGVEDPQGAARMALDQLNPPRVRQEFRLTIWSNDEVSVTVDEDGGNLGWTKTYPTLAGALEHVKRHADIRNHLV